MTKKTVFKLLSVRMTPDAYAELQAKAGDMTLSAYARATLLGDNAPKIKTRNKAPVKDYEALGRVLGLLGKSDLAASLAVLAKAARNGSLPVAPETEAALLKASSDIQAMRNALIKALGLKE